MKLDLKHSWNDIAHRELGEEFRNVREFVNAHDGGYYRWTTLNTVGSLTTGAVTKTASYAAAINDQIILADSTSNTVTITLPTAVGLFGRRYTVKDWKGKSATNNITIGTTAAQTIDGAATKVMNVNYQSYTVVSDGANWAVI